jgi:spermidine synthase
MAKRQLLFSQTIADGHVQVWQQDNRRWMDFENDLVQTEIILDRPDYLPLPLNRAMLSGVIFTQQPQHILLAGTGGGATARYFAKRFPDVCGQAVELSDVIATVAQDYFEFPDNNNWHLLTDDIQSYVKTSQQLYDVMVIDIAEDKLTPEWIIDRQFLQYCRARLTESGYVSINLLVNDANSFMHYLAEIRDAFDRQTVCLSLPNYQNIVILAFNQRPPYLLPDEIEKRLPELKKQWGLEFTEFYQQMLKDNPKDSGVL